MRLHRALLTLLGAALAIAPACASRAPADPAGADGGAADAAVVADADSLANGADPIVEKASFTGLFAMSDLHAHLDEMVALLQKSGLVTPGVRPFTWTAGSATLVLVGDYIDKGPKSLAVIEAIMELETAANAKGGTVISLLGNHEAEFLASPKDDKFATFDGIATELKLATPALDPQKFATGADPRAVWLRSRPIAAKVGNWFFCHGGDTHGASVASLRSELVLAFRTGSGFGDARIIGDTSPLQSRNWYTSATVAKNTTALGVGHIVFGHDPGAFQNGAISAPSQFGGKILKIDAGIGAGESAGEILHVRIEAGAEVVEAITPDGKVRVLFRS